MSNDDCNVAVPKERSSDTIWKSEKTENEYSYAIIDSNLLFSSICDQANRKMRNYRWLKNVYFWLSPTRTKKCVENWHHKGSGTHISCRHEERSRKLSLGVCKEIWDGAKNFKCLPRLAFGIRTVFTKNCIFRNRPRTACFYTA